LFSQRAAFVGNQGCSTNWQKTAWWCARSCYHHNLARPIAREFQDAVKAAGKGANANFSMEGYWRRLLKA
jgi:hypothetical protein